MKKIKKKSTKGKEEGITKIKRKKVCYKCKDEKDINDFTKDRTRKMGYHSRCKSCNKQYYPKNKNKIKKYIKQYNKENKDKIHKYNKQYYKENQETLKEYYKEYKTLNKKAWNKYNRDRRKTDPNFKLQDLLRARFYDVVIKKLGSNYKSNSIIDLIDCSINFLREYLENQFHPEMSWQNHGVIWEIDHIIGCIMFDLTQKSEQELCFHWTNLRPLFKTTKIAENFGYTDIIGNRNRDKSKLL